MATKINLLPEQLAVGEELDKITGIIKIVTGILAAISFFVAVLAVSYTFYLTKKLDRLNQENASYKQSIVSLESTEQGLVLVKDRIQKIQTILDSQQNEALLNKQKIIVDFFDETTSVEDSSIVQGSSRLELKTTNSQSLANLITQIIESKNDFSKINISNITFSPFSGYSMNLIIN